MNWKIYLLLPTLFFALLVFFLPETGHAGDMTSWWRWSEWLQEMGPGYIYNTTTNYHPIWLYGLYLFGALQESAADIEKNINYIKVIPLFFDFLCAFTAFYFIRFQPKNYLKPFILLFNLAFLYNSIIWGQVDSIPIFFVVMAIVLALQEKSAGSLLFYILAIYTKLQAIIFLPLFGLLLLPQHLKKPIRFGSSFLVLMGVQAIILLPFIWAGTLDGFWAVVSGAVDQYPQISQGAINFWSFICFPELDPVQCEDTVILWRDMTAKTWGFIFFFSSSAIALFPLLWEIILQIKTKKQNPQLTQLALLTASQITLIFFFFNTQMHERYSHGALVFLFLYGISSKNFTLYIICSIAYFFNMEYVLQAFPFFSYGTLIFDPHFLSLLYGIVIWVTFDKLYQIAFQKTARVVATKILYTD